MFKTDSDSAFGDDRKSHEWGIPDAISVGYLDRCPRPFSKVDSNAAERTPPAPLLPPLASIITESSTLPYLEKAPAPFMEKAPAPTLEKMPAPPLVAPPAPSPPPPAPSAPPSAPSAPPLPTPPPAAPVMGEPPRSTLYESLSVDMFRDQRVIKEITSGRRIAFYRIRGEIGSGNFSLVKLGIHALTKEKVAIKIVDKTKLDHKTQRFLSREIHSMERLHHPNIIRLYEVVETLAKLHIVMEYAGGGELFTKISNEGRLPEVDAKSAYAQIVAAIHYMHNSHIIHRDLKAENIFYADSGSVKVGDFGFSTVSRANETLHTSCGSPPYAAPELFKDEQYYGANVDIWALGVLLYFMVTGMMPFQAETVVELRNAILHGAYIVPSYISDSCVFLIRGILKNMPKDRFTLAEMMKSKWLEGQEFSGPLELHRRNRFFDSENGDEDERVAQDILLTMGIRREHITQANLRDSRNSITGTYRIVLHRLQKKHSSLYEPLTDSMVQKARSRVNTPLKEISKHELKSTSKMCCIF